MKTPDEIKKALAMCEDLNAGCGDCPYGKADYRCFMNSDALEYIEQLEERIAKMGESSGWISVKDRIPDAGCLFGKVYICATNATGESKGVMPLRYCAVVRRGKSYFEWRTLYDRACDWNVTHWMPLPEPPKEEANDENPG